MVSCLPRFRERPPPPEPVEYSGILFKRGPTRAHRHLKRYFELRGRWLVYYRSAPSADDEPALGWVDLCGAMLSNNSDGHHAFYIWGSHLSHDYALQAQSAESKRAWCTALLRGITWHTTPQNVTAMLSDSTPSACKPPRSKKVKKHGAYLRGRLDGETLMSGKLWRKSGSLLGKYRCRTYELRSEGLLLYWKTEGVGGGGPSGPCVPTDTSGGVFKTLNVEGATARATEDGFEVAGPHLPRAYRFVAESGADREGWVRAINRLATRGAGAVQADLPTPTPTPTPAIAKALPPGEDQPGGAPSPSACSHISAAEHRDAAAEAALAALQRVTGARIPGSMPHIARLRHALRNAQGCLEEVAAETPPRAALRAAVESSSATLETWLRLYALEKDQVAGEALLEGAEERLSGLQAASLLRTETVVQEVRSLQQWGASFHQKHRHGGCCAASDFAESFQMKVVELGCAYGGEEEEEEEEGSLGAARLPSVCSSLSQLDSVSSVSASAVGASPEPPVGRGGVSWSGLREGGGGGGGGVTSPATPLRTVVPVPGIPGGEAHDAGGSGGVATPREPIVSPRARGRVIAAACTRAEALQELLVREKVTAKNRDAVDKQVAEIASWRQQVITAAEAYGCLVSRGDGVAVCQDELLSSTLSRIDSVVKMHASTRQRAGSLLGASYSSIKGLMRPGREL